MLPNFRPWKLSWASLRRLTEEVCLCADLIFIQSRVSIQVGIVNVYFEDILLSFLNFEFPSLEKS